MVDTEKRIDQPPLFRYLPIVVLVGLILFSGYRIFRSFEDVVETRGGNQVLTRERATELKEKKRQLKEEYICYKLVASMDGIYKCDNCPNGYFYLFEGEVAKYGTTMYPNTRYPAYKLVEQNLSMIPIDNGSLTKMRQLELDLIYGYPLLEENLTRPSLREYLDNFSEDSKPRWKLARPPQNGIDQ